MVLGPCSGYEDALCSSVSLFDSPAPTSSRWRITESSKEVLEREFRRERFPSASHRLKLAKCLNVDPRRIQVWFQNRRQRNREVSAGAPEAIEGQSTNDAKAVTSHQVEVGNFIKDSVARTPRSAPAAAPAASSKVQQNSILRADMRSKHIDEKCCPQLHAALPTPSRKHHKSMRNTFGLHRRSCTKRPAVEASCEVNGKQLARDSYSVSNEYYDLMSRQKIGSLGSSSGDVMTGAFQGFNFDASRQEYTESESTTTDLNRLTMHGNELLQPYGDERALPFYEPPALSSSDMITNHHTLHGGISANDARVVLYDAEPLRFIKANHCESPKLVLQTQQSSVTSIFKANERNQDECGQYSLQLTEMSELDDLESWKTAAESVNFVLRCARQQYSLTAGEVAQAASITHSTMREITCAPHRPQVAAHQPCPSSFLGLKSERPREDTRFLRVGCSASATTDHSANLDRDTSIPESWKLWQIEESAALYAFDEQNPEALYSAPDNVDLMCKH